MREKRDMVDSALQSLGGRQWPGTSQNPELEERLMRAFDKQNSSTKIRRHPLLAACLAVLVLGSVGFAAAGGYELVRSWFVTVEVNGEVISSQEVIPDENGNAEFDLPPIELEEGETAIATITLDADEVDGEGDGPMRNISVTLDEDGSHVIVEQGEEED